MRKYKLRVRNYCSENCENYFKPFQDRVERELKMIHNDFGIGSTVIDEETKKRYAFVRLNRLVGRDLITKEDYNEILQHIENGHTFMAFIPLKNMKGKK